MTLHHHDSQPESALSAESGRGRGECAWCAILCNLPIWRVFLILPKLEVLNIQPKLLFLAGCCLYWCHSGISSFSWHSWHSDCFIITFLCFAHVLQACKPICISMLKCVSNFRCHPLHQTQRWVSHHSAFRSFPPSPPQHHSEYR